LIFARPAFAGSARTASSHLYWASAAKPWPRRISGRRDNDEDVRDRNTKTAVPVEVVRVVPVAVGTARVPAIIDERTTA